MVFSAGRPTVKGWRAHRCMPLLTKLVIKGDRGNGACGPSMFRSLLRSGARCERQRKRKKKKTDFYTPSREKQEVKRFVPWTTVRTIRSTDGKAEEVRRFYPRHYTANPQSPPARVGGRPGRTLGKHMSAACTPAPQRRDAQPEGREANHACTGATPAPQRRDTQPQGANMQGSAGIRVCEEAGHPECCNSKTVASVFELDQT